MWQDPNCEKTQELNLEINLKLKLWKKKEKKSCDKPQLLELQIKKKIITQIATRLKNSNCDKSHNLKLWQNSISNKTQKF